MVKHWSTTQKCITLSHGEDQVSGVVSGVAESRSRSVSTR